MNTKEDDDDIGAMRFDSDSYYILIDNCCSRSLSFNEKDFISGSIRPLNTTNIIKRFGNSETTITHTGTISWNIIEDEGINRQIIITNSYLVPTAGVRLLSLQHWSQEMNEVNNEGISCITYGDKIVIT
jgi:hypothetical protein